MRFHREGNSILMILTLVLCAINFFVGWFFGIGGGLVVSLTLSIIVFTLFAQFFRVPSRKIANSEQNNFVICPADGKVVVIEEVEEPEYFKDKRIQVSIFMSPLNVHVQWMPLGGKISYFKYHPGLYLVAWHPKSSTENERSTIVVNTGSHEVLFRQIAGAVARRIRYYVKQGDQLNKGDECGFIKFGSRVDIFLPLNADIKVKIGDKVSGRDTVLAEI
jgi:phosphatidylserine decarboxylase